MRPLPCLATALAAALMAAPRAQEATTVLSPADEARVADARERRGEHYAERLALFLEELPRVQPGGVVFIGDSITEHFPLDRAFPGRNVVNRGISGDHITGVTERIDVSAGLLSPERVYLMIGINDITWGQQATPEQLGADFGDLLDALAAACGGAEITVQSILPVATRWSTDNPNVRALNGIIRGHAERLGLRYLDLHPRMASASGELRAEYTGDGVHLTLAGYGAWLEAITASGEFFDVARALAPHWRETAGTSHRIDALDPPREGEYGGSRGPDQLIVYTDDYGHATTGTNPWGTEATVIDGAVTHTGGNDSVIPAGGYVVSGHGAAAHWISTVLLPGTRVALDGLTVRAQPPPESEMSTPRRLQHLVSRVIESLPDLAGERLEQARGILADLQTLRADDSHVSPETADAISRRVAALTAPPE